MSKAKHFMSISRIFNQFSKINRTFFFKLIVNVTKKKLIICNVLINVIKLMYWNGT